ncbi:VacJ family lipoprotein [Phaeobacter sp. CNT1-3]|nr:VacJ family lipoprotein [Phaeobacter sp. CNT1-3]
MSFPMKSALRATVFLSATAIAVAGCTTVEDTPRDFTGINDPFENTNRAVHRFNVGVDRAVLRPVSKGYDAVVPDDVQTMVSNASDNLGEPSNLINHTLQGNVGGAAKSLYRFVINSTVGLGGIYDVAAEFGVTEDETDFGTTLHAWGGGEGAYLELPLLGPSTTRDATGRVVDVVLNPLSHVLNTDERQIRTGINVADRVGQRAQLGDAIDSVLYESADSYSQTQLLYLQNRRFELGIEADDTYIDPNDIDTEGF